MIPKSNQDLTNDFEIKKEPSRTFALNIDKGCVNGDCEGLEAIKQAIYLMLNIERYEHVIYSWNYGIETKELIGKDVTYILPELKRRVIEALTQDNRILSVDAFEFEFNKGKVYATFNVNTIYGDVEVRKGVRI